MTGAWECAGFSIGECVRYCMCEWQFKGSTSKHRVSLLIHHINCFSGCPQKVFSADIKRHIKSEI